MYDVLIALATPDFEQKLQSMFAVGTVKVAPLQNTMGLRAKSIIVIAPRREMSRAEYQEFREQVEHIRCRLADPDGQIVVL